jgi:glycosyltransferase involved in cell wall biosynthesis
MNSTRTPVVSVIVPVYNVERFVERAIRSVLEQSFTDFELIIVDDGGHDASMLLCDRLADDRTRILHQSNRGLAGARNTGIAEARGEFVALLDADDAWSPEKLALHVAHLQANPEVGISYSGSELIDESDNMLGIRQQPLLGRVEAHHVFCGQAIQNGSAPVFRREVLVEAALRPDGTDRVWYFDETLRRSEDVECWTRIALRTKWKFAAIRGAHTFYRVNAGGLSADVIRQLDSWDRVAEKIATYAPDFTAAYGPEARARELRYLARRSFQARDRGLAFHLACEALRTCPRLLTREPRKTLTTLLACALLRLLPEGPFHLMARALGAPTI